MRLRIGGAWSLAFALLLLSAAPVRALTLADLVSDDPTLNMFTTGNVTYSDFDVRLFGDLDPDLSQYGVVIDPGGFTLGGPLFAFGTANQLSLDFKVTANVGVLDAALLTAAQAGENGARAGTFERLLDPEGDLVGTMEVASGVSSEDSLSLGGLELTMLMIRKEIWHDAQPPVECEVVEGREVCAPVPFPQGDGPRAITFSVSQGFNTNPPAGQVPEPSLSMLVVPGLLGLLLAGRRRRSSRAG